MIQDSKNMIKTILFGLIGLMTSGIALAGDKPVITVADVEAVPGETVSFSVNLIDGKADTYTAMTLYVQFPTTGFTTTDNYSVTDSWANCIGVVGNVNEEGLATIPFASSNAIQGSAVENLITVNFTVDEKVELGEYDVTLKGTMFEYNYADKDYADDVTFKVKVVERHTIILDENSTTVPVDTNGVNIRVLKNIKAYEWSTICLPFAMTEEQVKSVFGDDVELGDFTGCIATYEDNNVTDLKLNFSHEKAIEANHPYIIKVSSDMTEFSLNEIDITPEEEPSVDRDEFRTGTGSKKDPFVYHYNSLIGTYVTNTVVPELCVYLNGGQFCNSDGNAIIKGYSAYFDLYDAEDANTPVSMSFPSSDTTGLGRVSIVFTDSHYFDLMGRTVKTPAKGVYIRGKKKVVVK